MRSNFINLVLIFAMLFSLLMVAQVIRVHAQTPLSPTQINIGAPAQAPMGETLTVQAVIVDGQGHPISKEVISFTSQVTFLGKTSDVVLAQAVTNASGQAVAEFVNNFSGTFQLNAEFQGDAEYAPSTATAQVETTGSQQVYIEHIGVDIPGLNVPPFISPMASFQSPQPGILGLIKSLWPAMNGWPIAAILFLVWVTYLNAMKYVLQIARMGVKIKEPDYPQTPGSGRTP